MIEPDAIKAVEARQDLFPDTYGERLQAEALVSIAISMKRIADALTPDPERGTFFQQADSWFHHWLGTWIRSR